MNDFLKKTLLYILVLLPIFYAMHYVGKKFSNYHEYYGWKINFVKEQQPSKIILGTSHGTHGINPKYLSPRNDFFNFAFNGASPSYYKLMTETGVLPVTGIDTLIYQVDWFMFDTLRLWRRYEYDAPAYSMADILKGTNKEHISVSEMLRKKYNFPVEAIANILDRKNPNDNFFDYNMGYISYNNVKDAEWKMRKAKISDKETKALRELLEIYRTAGSKIIFVSTPEFNEDTTYYTNDSALTIIRNIADSFDIPFHDFNLDHRSSINTNKDLYHDWGHLNDKGAALYSGELGKLIR